MKNNKENNNKKDSKAFVKKPTFKITIEGYKLLNGKILEVLDMVDETKANLLNKKDNANINVEQNFDILRARICDLREFVKNSEIYDPECLAPDTIKVGDTVCLYIIKSNNETGEYIDDFFREMTIMPVGSRIDINDDTVVTSQSPFGKNLLGKTSEQHIKFSIRDNDFTILINKVFKPEKVNKVDSVKTKDKDKK